MNSLIPGGLTLWVPCWMMGRKNMIWCKKGKRWKCGRNTGREWFLVSKNEVKFGDISIVEVTFSLISHVWVGLWKGGGGKHPTQSKQHKQRPEGKCIWCVERRTSGLVLDFGLDRRGGNHLILPVQKSSVSYLATSFTEELIWERTFWPSTDISLRQLIGAVSWFLRKKENTWTDEGKWYHWKGFS